MSRGIRDSPHFYKHLRRIYCEAVPSGGPAVFEVGGVLLQAILLRSSMRELMVFLVVAITALVAGPLKESREVVRLRAHFDSVDVDCVRPVSRVSIATSVHPARSSSPGCGTTGARAPSP